jgi:hypothetical protein
MIPLFDSHLRNWVKAACRQWGYEDPSENYYSKFYETIPSYIQNLILRGIEKGLIEPLHEGSTVRVMGGSPGRLTQLFNRTGRKEHFPDPNWKAFVHLAEFVHLHELASPQDLIVEFDLNSMDLALWKGEACEYYGDVKGDEAEVKRLVELIERRQKMPLPPREFGEDGKIRREDDGLTKARQLIKYRPKGFSIITKGEHESFRVDYLVEYPEDDVFELIPEKSPWVYLLES